MQGIEETRQMASPCRKGHRPSVYTSRHCRVSSILRSPIIGYLVVICVMYGLKQLSLLSLMLLSVSAAKNSKRTIVGIETADKSRGIDVPLNDCHAIEEEDVLTVSLRKPCRLFTGPDCTGHNTFLSPGDHSSKDPIPVIESIFCQSSF
ncbi:hypothetical protein PENVUL_c026G07511 [Penicillium vulpinum]|uniref:Uncharacterized protein n=1 Tax=Penicillium vulpinum TaxID=29845 RepID=A0A1V6RUK9_9EURO|nr:hypothetical protein PENVUL_c026G07511 [Penicillium vulpinum]